MTLIDEVRADLGTAPVTPKLAALLRITGAVQESGQAVRAEDVAIARDSGGRLLTRPVNHAGTICVEDPAYVVDLGNWGCPKFPRKPDAPR